jgi:cytochrome c-type biogenesis protein CcmH
MLLWCIFAVVTAGALAVVLSPLARAPRTEAAGAGRQAVLRSQLDEIEAARALGTLADDEAAAARTELSRRALAGAAKAARQPGAGLPPRRRRLALAVAAAVPLLTIAVYLLCGSPEMASLGAPGAHAPLARAEIGELVAQVEARLRERPDDGRGWDVIAPVYLKLGRYRDAANAFAQATRLQGETLARLGGFAEASVLAANGRVDEEAQRAYAKILLLEPGRLEARYWLALGKEQDGNLAAALADYQRLLQDVPADAGQWRKAITGRIAEVTERLGAKPLAPPGLTEEQLRAGASLSPAEREKFIARMVDGLAERLRRDGADLAGWQRLITSYAVLGRDGEARRALAEAQRQFAGDPQALGELAARAKSLGLGS